ncbi:transposase, mutator type [Artemisia annua]|uniref:Transposase, mutator type n=1 Tax=Artemisia annua TaxID=35608 RepID=A0A2U1KMF3_ARTAN|nr:transposase, mutator type [Artemisia annua]
MRTCKALCGLLLNNICEVFNSQLNDVRDRTIITCLEYIREYLMKRIVVVQQIIEKSVGQLTPTVQAMFDAIKKEATDCVVEWTEASLYKVSVPNEDHCVVNMDRKECGCRKWELTGIPCKHAVAALNYTNEDGRGVGIPEEWVHARIVLQMLDVILKLRLGSETLKSLEILLERMQALLLIGTWSSI